ncbi:hypothetical protein JD276_14095 [Leucobacter sp. CSA1]|uniref:Terminase n=1 Tax=Leucobacter chromiisoli TaxID=2796471 RepID=A0A934Q8F6_9MICO|nr:hypothetical protein [Leucobacter chromiisoli]MBK0420165.1 hypothetical protein [Leucobacter chromiisoli]
MVKSARPSMPRLSEVARHLVYPDTIESSLFPRVQARLAECGVGFDPWQQGFGTVGLGLDCNGKFASTVGGVVASIPRQVGKTYTIGHLMVGLCLELPGLRVIWTSHHLATTGNTFQTMQGIARRPKIAKHVAEIRLANGEQRIVFKNGSVIMFGARSHGFGLGMDAIDVVVFDEAQRLSLRSLEDMVPTTNQARNPHGALLFFIGTPPRPLDDGDSFAAKRRQALAGKSNQMTYVEFSADPDAKTDDRKQWAKMNPSFPYRTPVESMLRMRENMPDEDAWRREAMGIWDSDGFAKAIPVSSWNALVSNVMPEGRAVYGVKFTADGSGVALAKAVRPDIGPVFVRPLEQRNLGEGYQWLVDQLAELAADAAQIVVDGKSGVGYLVNALRDTGVKNKRLILLPTLDQVIAAHSMFEQAVLSGELSHPGIEKFDQQVLSATKRKIGNNGGFGWEAPEGETVVSLDAATLAFWGARTTKRRPGRGVRVSA